MKQILVLIACIIGIQTFGQEFKLDMDKVKKYLDQNKVSQGFAPTKPQKQLLPLLIKKSVFDTARFSHTTAQGDVFILPQDQMPCLTHQKNSLAYNMPNAIPKPAAYETIAAQMPNAYQGRKLILAIPQKINPPATAK